MSLRRGVVLLLLSVYVLFILDLAWLQFPSHFRRQCGPAAIDRRRLEDGRARVVRRFPGQYRGIRPDRHDSGAGQARALPTGMRPCLACPSVR